MRLVDDGPVEDGVLARCRGFQLGEHLRGAVRDRTRDPEFIPHALTPAQTCTY